MRNRIPDCCEFPILVTIEGKGKRCVNCGADLNNWYYEWKKNINSIDDNVINAKLRKLQRASK